MEGARNSSGRKAINNDYERLTRAMQWNSFPGDVPLLVSQVENMACCKRRCLSTQPTLSEADFQEPGR